MKLQKTMRKEYFLVIGIILLMSFVSAATKTQQFSTGYLIEDNPQYILKQNQNYQVNFFVYNISNGVSIAPVNAVCYFYLANNSGNVLIYTNTTYNTDGHWETTIGAGNLSELGYYGYGIKCQGSNLGGAIAGVYEVTSTGMTQPEGASFILTGLFLLTFGVSVFFLILFLKIDSPPVKLFFLLLSFIFLIGSLLVAISVSSNSALPTAITSTITYIFYALGLVFTVVFAFILINQILNALDMMRQKKGYETGF